MFNAVSLAEKTFVGLPAIEKIPSPLISLRNFPNFTKFNHNYEKHGEFFIMSGKNPTRRNADYQLVGFFSYESMKKFQDLIEQTKQHYLLQNFNIFDSYLINSSYIYLPNILAYYSTDPINIVKYREKKKFPKSYISNKNRFLYTVLDKNQNASDFIFRPFNKNYMFIRECGISLFNRVSYQYQKDDFIYKPNEFLIKFNAIEDKYKFLNNISYHSISDADSRGFHHIKISNYKSFLYLHRSFHTDLDNVTIIPYGYQSERAEWYMDFESLLVTDFPDYLSLKELYNILGIEDIFLKYMTTYLNKPAIIVYGTNLQILELWFKNGLNIDGKIIKTHHVFKPNKYNKVNELFIGDLKNNICPENFLKMMNVNLNCRSHVINKGSEFSDYSLYFDSYFNINKLNTNDESHVNLSSRHDDHFVYYFHHVYKITYSQSTPKIAQILRGIIKNQNYIYPLESCDDNSALIYMIPETHKLNFGGRNGDAYENGILTFSKYSVPLVKKSSIVMRNEIILVFPRDLDCNRFLKKFDSMCHKIQHINIKNKRAYYKLYIKKRNHFFDIDKEIKDSCENSIFILFDYEPVYSHVFHDEVLIQNLPLNISLDTLFEKFENIDFHPIKILNNHDSKTIHVKIFPDIYHDIFYMNGCEIDNRHISVVNYSNETKKSSDF